MMDASFAARLDHQRVRSRNFSAELLHHVRGHHHDHHTLVNAGERDIVSEEGGEEKSAREGACAGATAVGCLWLVPRV
jgi:hypothetical protein